MGELQKKKEKVMSWLAARFASFSSQKLDKFRSQANDDLFFFFFLEITRFFHYFAITQLLPQQTSLDLHLSVPVLFKNKLKWPVVLKRPGFSLQNYGKSTYKYFLLYVAYGLKTGSMMS